MSRIGKTDHIGRNWEHSSGWLDKKVFWILERGLRCALIRCTLGPGKSKKGWDFGGEGIKGAMGDKGSSLRATWERGGRLQSQLEGAK
jgi:hypothetical protein